MDKQKIIELAKKKKLVANWYILKDIDNTWKDAAVYFNERMTSILKNFFFKARNMAKEKD